MKKQKEKKTARAELVLKPSIKDKGLRRAEELNISFNKYVEDLIFVDSTKKIIGYK